MENNDQNTNNIKGKKRITGFLVFIIVVLLLIIGVSVGWYCGKSGDIFNKDNEAGDNNAKNEIVGKTQEMTSDENKAESKEELKEDAKKVIAGRPLVYNSKLKEIKSIVTKTGEYICNSNDCYCVPYLNINSTDAKKINNEIEKIYLDSYNRFGTSASDNFSGPDDYCHKDNISYEWYINENIVSIVLHFNKFYAYVGNPGEGGIGGGQGTEYVYNFNVETLKEVTLDEMAKICGFNSAEEVENKVKAWDENVKKDEEKSMTYTGVKDKYFIGENKKLNFIYGWSASGSGEKSMVVEPNKEIEEY